MSEKEKKGAAGAQVAPAMGPPGLIAKEDIPAVLPILPLRNSVFFPGGVLPLAVGRQKTIALIKDAVRDEQVIGVVTQRRAEVEALAINLKKLVREVIELMTELPAAATELVESITHPGHLADLIAANVDVAIEEQRGQHGEEQEALGELAARLKKAGLPPELDKVAHKELTRLKSIPTAS